MTLTIRSPYDQRVIAEIERHSDDAIDGALTRAREAQRAWRKIPLPERVQQVRAALNRFRQDRDAIASEVSQQMGKPIGEAGGEVDTCYARGMFMCSIAEESLAADRLEPKPGFVRRIEHVPLGVVLNIVAWNYPLFLPINVVTPAILAGNAVLLKHADLTALTGARFASIFSELSVPHLVQNLVIDHRQCATVIGDARTDHVCFTGSVRGGREVYRQAAAAEHILDVGLELGGKDPAYVAADADLDFAVAGLVDGACYNAGQSCCAVERAYVHASVYDEFIDRARKLMSAYRLGDPSSADTTLGPLARAAQIAVLQGQVETAQAAGARLICGGTTATGIEHGGGFFMPTLLADVDNASAAMQEESFGPILPIAKVDSDEHAIQLMDDCAYGLTASVWTADQERAEKVASALDVGTVYQNRCDYLDPALPWTGARMSGKGSTLSRYGFVHLTRRKSIHFRIAT